MRHDSQSDKSCAGHNVLSQGVKATKKYKPVAQKVKPTKTDLPDEFRIVRDIKGDSLADMPKLSPRPPEFVPTGC